VPLVSQISLMSKFDNLWQGYIHLSKDYTRYKNACFEFIPKLVDGIITNLGWPREKVGYVLLKEQLEFEKYLEGQYKIDTTLLPDGPGFWKFGLRLHLSKEISHDNVDPVDFVIPMAVGKSITAFAGTNSFVVAILGKANNDSFTVNETDNFEEISDCIYKRVANKLNAEIHWSMEQQQGQSKIFYLDS